MAVFSAAPAFAATITVTNQADSGPGSLRDTIAAAAPGDTINFSLTLPATIILTSGELLISKNLTISGPGASSLAISGSNASRVFEISNASTVSISGLTIENGSTDVGAGILNSGTLILTNSTVSRNSASNSGGGIVNQGMATVTNSTVSGNRATIEGGGILNASTLTLTNSTLSGNDSCCYFGGGGIFNQGMATVTNSTFLGNSTSNANLGGGGILNEGTLTLTNSTFSGNSGHSYYGYGGGAILFYSGSATLKNTIVANSLSGGNCYSAQGSSFTSQGYNLSDDNSCSMTGPGDLNNTPAGLDPSGLKNNGGPTQTIALLATSAAVNAIPLNPTNYCTDVNGASVDTDQRGVTRPQGPACDIGAFELVTDDDSAFSQLNGGNAFAGNQTVNGNVNATAFVGNGTGLTGVTAANSQALGGVPASNFARLDIGNIFSGNQTIGGNVSANAFVGDGSRLTNITSSTANFANAANFASTANDSAFLGGIAGSNYARLDIGNAFTGSQNISGDLNITGNFSGAAGNLSGNVGLGVASPISKLSISSAGNDGIRLSGTSPAVFFHSGPEGTAGTQKGGLGLAQGPDNYGVGTLANDLNLFTQSGNINFNTATSLVNPSIRMTVTADGNIGIGTATPHATLEVNGTTQFDNTVTFAPGQTFPGTAAITGVTAGPGLFGGGTTGSVNLGVDQHVVAFQSDLSNGINTAESFATAAASAAQGNAISTAESNASSIFLPLAGGTLTGSLVGTGATFSGTATAGQVNALGSYLVSGVPVLNANATYGGQPNGFLGGSVSVGIGAGPTTGPWNTYLGYNAGAQQPASNVVSNNTFVGKFAGGGATSGFNNSFFGANAGSGTTGTGNTFLGYAAGSGVTTGSSNTIIGSFAGGISGPLTGSQNVYLGVNINPPLNESNTIRIGLNGSQSAAYLAGVYGGSTSSGVPVYVDANGHLGTVGGTVIGSITGITAGPGLTGGGTTGNVSLSVPAAGITNGMLANPTLSVTAGAGLTGGGPVSLGGSTAVALATNTCAAGSAVIAHPFSCSPFAGLGANTFIGNQTMPGLTVTSGFGNFTKGLTASSSSDYGVSSFSFYNAGVYGSSAQLYGVVGSGPFAGVYGNSNGAGAGAGVYGTSSSSAGVHGSSNSGPGILADSITTSSTSAAGIFNNGAAGNAGNILLGQSLGVTKFSVDAKGDVTASGSVTIGTGGTPILEHLSQAFTVSVPGVSPNNCANLAPVTLTGASDGYTIALGVPNALVAGTPGDFLEYFAWVSATNTVTIRVCNPHGGSANSPVSGSIRVDVWKH